jgi:Tir chaperone protein (CesT) family
MTALTRTRALMADLAAALGLPALPQDDTGGFRLTVGEGTEILLYGGDDESLLIIAPIAPLPTEPSYGLVVYLLRSNLFDSDVAPFQIAVDDGGALIFWGRVRIAEMTGAALASLIDRVAERATLIAGEVADSREQA